MMTQIGIPSLNAGRSISLLLPHTSPQERLQSALHIVASTSALILGSACVKLIADGQRHLAVVGMVFHPHGANQTGMEQTNHQEA